MPSLKRLLRGKSATLEAEWVIVGLGNAGPGYAQNRHNVGFQVINELGKRARVKPVRIGTTMAAGAGELGGHKIALVKPLTMMNASGKAVRQALDRTKGELARTIVIYDDLDTATGGLRIREGGGHGGHNGLKSIAAEAGGLGFIRIKIGIGRPTDGDGEPTWDPGMVSDYVLSDPVGAERETLREAVERAADAVEVIMSEGVEIAISRFNRKSGETPARGPARKAAPGAEAVPGAPEAR